MERQSQIRVQLSEAEDECETCDCSTHVKVSKDVLRDGIQSEAEYLDCPETYLRHQHKITSGNGTMYILFGEKERVYS